MYKYAGTHGTIAVARAAVTDDARIEIDSEGSSEQSQSSSRVGNSEFACCLMWTPIHPITWVAPFVGHMGICDSSGRLHDWGGGPIDPCPPRFMMFGQPTRYIRFQPPDLAAWDAAIEKADREYLDKIHCMACGSDCHSHTARVLDILGVGGCRFHNKVELAAAVFFCGRHIGVQGWLATWLGTAVVLIVVLVVRALT